MRSVGNELGFIEPVWFAIVAQNMFRRLIWWDGSDIRCRVYVIESADGKKRYINLPDKRSERIRRATKKDFEHVSQFFKSYRVGKMYFWGILAQRLRQGTFIVGPGHIIMNRIRIKGENTNAQNSSKHDEAAGD